MTAERPGGRCECPHCGHRLALLFMIGGRGRPRQCDACGRYYIVDRAGFRLIVALLAIGWGLSRFVSGWTFWTILALMVLVLGPIEYLLIRARPIAAPGASPVPDSSPR